MEAPIWLSVLVLPVLAGNLVGGIVMIVGALKMRRLQSYRWAMAASILALLPCGPGNVLGLAMGTWSLLVLNRGNVIAAFDASETLRRRGGAPPAGQPRVPTTAGAARAPGRKTSSWPVIAVIVLLVGLLSACALAPVLAMAWRFFS